MKFLATDYRMELLLLLRDGFDYDLMWSNPPYG